MITEIERFHGVALARLVRAAPIGSEPVRVAQLNRSAYLLNDGVILYVKYSTSRLSPWLFNFTRTHQQDLERLSATWGDLFTVLVCGGDGVACLARSELRQVLDDDHESSEWVKAARRPREKYSVSGSDGRLRFKVGDNEFPGKVYASLTRLRVRTHAGSDIPAP